MKRKVGIIGGGPGGYVAAIKLSQLGAEVTLFEKEKLGGTCLNVGCIPTKVLLHYSELMDEIKAAERLGLKIKDTTLSWDKVQDHRLSVSNRLVDGVESLMKTNKIKVIRGTASFISKDEIQVSNDEKERQIYKFDSIIIATGSAPAMPLIEGLIETDNIINSTGALELKSVPKSLTVIGGGVIGLELADAYMGFGAKVNIIELMPKILSNMEESLSVELKKILEKKGMQFNMNSKVISIEDKKEEVTVTFESNGKKNVITSEKVLVAIGRKPYTEKLGLEKIGVNIDRGRIVVNKYMETNVPGIYAIGDCIGDIMLAHVASEQGEIAAENIMLNKKAYEDVVIPSCVYTNPEFASVGLTESCVKEKGIEYNVGVFPLVANGKALISNGGIGSVKVITGKEFKEILGVHILGPRATDLIAEAALAIKMEATTEDIIETIHAHPTLSEAFREAVLGTENMMIHMPNKKS